MYDDSTATKIEKIASDAIDSTQSKIDQLNEMGANIRSKAGEQLVGWQSWLGNIAFALSAILGAFLIGKELPSFYSLLSFFILLITGIWITLFHKQIFEKAAITGSSAVDEFRILYDDKKKAAFDLFMDPHNVNNHLEFLKRELKIAKLGKKNENILLNEVSNDKTSYLNDLWLTMLVSAIYFMMQPVGEKVFSYFHLSHTLYLWLFWIAWAILIFIIWRYEALSTKESISKSKEDKVLKIKSQLKHSNAYVKRVNNEVKLLQQKLSELKNEGTP